VAEENPTGSLYHLSHGQREPVSSGSFSLPESIVFAAKGSSAKTITVKVPLKQRF
jgi:hypothetical protein